LLKENEVANSPLPLAEAEFNTLFSGKYLTN